MMSSGPSSPVEFTITRKMMTMHAGTFVVTDADGNIAFNVQGKSMSLHDRRVLLDTAGNPIITFQQKVTFTSTIFVKYSSCPIMF